MGNLRDISIAAKAVMLLALSAALCVPANAASTATLIVQVSGDLSRGVRVELSGGALAAPVTKTTNRSGAATFTRLSPGTYTVTPRRTNFRLNPESRSVTFTRARPQTVRFRAVKLPGRVGFAACQRCHGATPAFTKWSASKHRNTTPVVQCEDCHGGGAQHAKNPTRVAIPFRAPSEVRCGQCHNKDFLKTHPAAGPVNDSIYEKYAASPHATSITPAVFADARRKIVTAVCSKCHTDEGARLFKDLDGDANTLPGQFTGAANVSKATAVQCRTCHDAHNPALSLEAASAATATAGARSAQFNTCTNCHQLVDANDNKILPFHADAERTITDTHVDDPNTLAQEGYNINRASEAACSSCHNPHDAQLVFNLQWAASGHGNRVGEAWIHYDWKGNNRLACQKCHTATGFMNLVNNPAAYNAAVTAGTPINDFSYLKGSQNEVLYCGACHSDEAFSRRKITPVTFPSGKSVDLGDDSNLCMVCHQGRESKVSVDAKIAAKPAGPFSFTNIHYYAAAAIYFGSEVNGGYEYDGGAYVTRNLFAAHPANRKTCVGCHMRQGATGAPDHHFAPQVADCSGCHKNIGAFKEIRPANTPDYDGDGNTAEGLQGEIETIENKLLPQIQNYARTVLGTQIAYNPSSHPYWFVDSNGNGIIDGDETTGFASFDAKLLRAAYNYQVSRKEPCGYIHSHKYILQLLYDSLLDIGGLGAVTGVTRPS